MLPGEAGARHDRAVRRLLLPFLCALPLVMSTPACVARDVVKARVAFASGQGSKSELPPQRHLEPFDIERATPSDDPALSVEPSSALSALSADEDPLLFGLRSAVILSGAKSVGATSLVLKLPLDGGLVAAFKPDTKKHRGRYRAEIAAYRLSRALSLEGVPPSVPRAAKISALLASIGRPSTRARLTEQMIASGPDALVGAMIAWLPSLRVLPLEKAHLWTAWGEWLSQTTPKIPIERRLGRAPLAVVMPAKELVPQISSMIAFDHLTGNRDRWSGHNVMVDETGRRLIFLDNNLAFDEKLDVASTRKREKVLARVERFSRALITAVRKLTRDDLVRIFGVDQDGAPLLSAAQIDACLSRRDELLAHVDRLIVRYGQERVLAYE